MKMNLPHLVVTDFEQANFTGKSGGSSRKDRPERKRNEHGAFLKRQLELAWADSKNDEVVYHTNRNGVYLEFKGEQGTN